MKAQHYTKCNNTSTVDIHDIIEVFEHNYFPIQKQIDLLQVLNLALIKRQKPFDACGCLAYKIEVLKQNLDFTDDTDNSKVCIKVRAVTLLKMLNEMDLGTTKNDLTKICKLIACLLECGYKSIYTQLQRGITFSKRHHEKQIDEVNKIFKNLNSSISIDMEKQY
jgi:hypothetical protein